MSNAWLIAAAVTVASHGGIAAWLEQRDPAPRAPTTRVMRFEVIAPAPKPKVEPPPLLPPPPPALPRRVERPRARRRAPEPPAAPEPTPVAEPAPSGLAPDQSAPAGDLVVEGGGGIEGALQAGAGRDQTPAPPPPAAEGPRSTGRFVPIFEVTRMPRAVDPVSPEVPEAFRRARREAVVVVEVAIAASGRVTEARVVKRAGFGLDEAAVAAARRTRFEPALVGDRAVAVKMQIPYRFKVRE